MLWAKNSILKQYLHTVLVCFIIVVIALLFFSCAPRYVWKPTCGHTSIYATMVVVDDYPPQIAHGFVIEGKFKDWPHTQAWYFRDKKWRPLQVVIWAEVFEGEVDYEMRDITYISGINLC